MAEVLLSQYKKGDKKYSSMPTIIDIVRLTPKTNCGKCGKLTCMAYAVSLLTGQIEPDACPYIDRDALAEVGFVVLKSDLKRDDPDTALLRELRSKISGLDLLALATGIGAEVTSDREGKKALALRYLGRTVIISSTTIYIKDGKELDPRDQILLYNYVFFGGSGPLSGTWVGLESFPNSVSKVVTLKKYTEDKISEEFGHNSEELVRRASRIGARLVMPCYADICLELPVLPKVPLQIHLWREEQDEGFPAKVKILFDKRAIEFLDLEPKLCSSRHGGQNVSMNI